MTYKNISFGCTKENKSSFQINSTEEKNFVNWFYKRPIISFNTDDVYLVYDPPDTRRRFIDLLGSQNDNEYLQQLIKYKYWISCRNTLLSTSFNDTQCDIYDEKIADAGTYIVQKRIELIEDMLPYLRQFHFEISDLKESVNIIYDSTMSNGNSSKQIGKNVFYKRLAENRKKDILAGYTSIGPHRDTIKFLINDRDAKYFCSQGQCRSLVISLRLATSVLLENYCKEKIIYLIDDTIAELDSYRTEKFFPLIQDKGQIFIAVPDGKKPPIKSFINIRIGDC